MNNNVPESTIQLLEATKLNNVDQVKALVGRGVDPNAQNEYGWTALMVAAACFQACMANRLDGPTVQPPRCETKGHQSK